MQRLLIVSLSFLAGLTLVASTAQAVYADPVSRKPITTDGSNCVLTPDPAQKSATTVYTLNINLTNTINDHYLSYWHRSARCDELQWHADRGTSVNKLDRWLRKVEIQRLRNHEYEGLVYSSGAHWRLINGKRQKVPDWLTQMAWGYVTKDGFAIHSQTKKQFLEAYPEIKPLNYTEGPYFQQVDDMWRNGTRTANVPQDLNDELLQYGFGTGYFLYRNVCWYLIRGCDSGYDWSFLYENACERDYPDNKCKEG